VLSADAVYTLDYAAVVAGHADSEAAVTMVTTEVDPDDAGRYGVVQLDGDRVADYAYKPDEPATSTISNEVFVFRPGELLDRLDGLAEGSGELEDRGREVGVARHPVDDPVGREVDAARDRALDAALDTFRHDQSAAAAAVREELASHLKRAATDGSDGDGARTAHELIHRRAISAARQTILDLRSRDEIGDDAFHRLEEEFDWLEMGTLAGADPESGEA